MCGHPLLPQSVLLELLLLLPAAFIGKLRSVFLFQFGELLGGLKKKKRRKTRGKKEEERHMGGVYLRDKGLAPAAEEQTGGGTSLFV